MKTYKEFLAEIAPDEKTKNILRNAQSKKTEIFLRNMFTQMGSANPELRQYTERGLELLETQKKNKKVFGLQTLKPFDGVRVNSNGMSVEDLKKTMSMINRVYQSGKYPLLEIKKVAKSESDPIKLAILLHIIYHKHVEIYNFVKENKEDSRMKNFLKLFQNGRRPTERQYEGLVELMKTFKNKKFKADIHDDIIKDRGIKANTKDYHKMKKQIIDDEKRRNDAPWISSRRIK